MGVSTGDSGGVDVEINVVPFIDLMSCLTAFLLVTAVWSAFAQINIKPKGLGRDATKPLDTEIPVNASVLLTQGEIWVGLTTGEKTQIGKNGELYDWEGLGEILAGYKEMPVFETRNDIEIAAEDDVMYQAVIFSMDVAIASQFRDIGFIDPQSLSVKFKE